MAAIIQVDYNKHIVQHRSRHRTVLDHTGRPVAPRHHQSPYHLSPLSQRHHHKVYNILWSANRYVNRKRVKQHETWNELCGCKRVFSSYLSFYPLFPFSLLTPHSFSVLCSYLFGVTLTAARPCISVLQLISIFTDFHHQPYFFYWPILRFMHVKSMFILFFLLTLHNIKLICFALHYLMNFVVGRIFRINTNLY